MMKHHYLLLFPIITVVFERLYNGISIIHAAWLPDIAPTIPTDGLLVSPEFAFGWIQVVVNIGMSAVLLWAIWVLWRCLRQFAWLGKREFSTRHGVATLFLLAFCLPAVWHGFWAIAALWQGRILFDWQNPTMMAVWLGQLGLLFLPWAIWRAYRRAPAIASRQPENKVGSID